MHGFTDKCPENLKEFFEGVISKAEEQGMQIYWGRKGFSLRARDNTDNMISLFYGFPPGTNERDITHIQGYVGGIEDEVVRVEIQRKFLNVKGTTAQGKYTANLNLTADNLDAAEELLQVVWDAKEELGK